jgi:hypothetical protein
LSESGTHGGGVSLPSAPMVAAERGKLTSRDYDPLWAVWFSTRRQGAL